MRIFAEWADMYPLVSRLPPHLLSLRPPVTAAVAAAAVAECTRPRRPALSSPQQRARDHMSRDLIPHRLLRRHGSTWPGDDHATFRAMGRHVSPRFPISPTSAFSFNLLQLLLLPLLLSLSAHGHAVRLKIPLLLRTARKSTIILQS